MDKSPGNTLKMPAKTAYQQKHLLKVFRVERWMGSFFLIVSTAVLFYFGARLGLMLTIPDTNIGLIWPPVGIAVALMLVLGYQIWPAIAIGAYLSNLPYYLQTMPFPSSIITTTGITMVDVVEVLLTAFLLKRYLGSESYFSRVENVIKFVCIVSLSQAVTAVLGVSSHFLSVATNASLFLELWFSYWISNIISIILITSLVLSWVGSGKKAILDRLPLQLAYFLITSGLTYLAVRYPLLGTMHYFEYVTILFVIIAAFAFGLRGAATVNLIVAVVVILTTIAGSGPFHSAEPNKSLIIVEIYLTIISLTTLFIVALLSERRAAQAALKTELELQVSLAGFAQSILTADSLHEITDLALHKAREITNASDGFVGYIDPPTGELSVYAVTQSVEDGLKPRSQVVIYTEIEGAFAWLIKNKEVLIINNAAQDSRFRDLPDFRLKIDQFLSVPGLLGQQVIGLIALANPGRDFTQRDSIAIQRLMSIFSLGIQRLQSEIEVRNLNADLEQRVSARTLQLEAANKELEAFSYSVSHDLRAPLRSIDGFSGILQEDYSSFLPADGINYLTRIRNSARRMGLLIDDLLEFSRLSRHQLKREPVQMADLARQALQSLSDEQAGRKIDLVISEMPICQGDSHLLLQVWENLISNALKYSRPRDTAQIEIGCIIRPSAENVYFIKDNGVGFDMQYAGSLFTVFQRLHTSNEFEGTGVGLALVQRIISRHGGSIWFEAAVDQGATFYFTLPGI